MIGDRDFAKTTEAPNTPPSTEFEPLPGPSTDPDNIGQTLSTPKNPKERPRIGIESFVLALIALLSVVFGVVQGFIPILLILGASFGSLALLCFLRHPLSGPLRASVFVASLLFAGALGVALDWDTFGVHYRYLSRGSVEYRVDEKAGRTDRLGPHGWVPVAYDKLAQVLPTNMLDSPAGLTLSSGDWAADGGNGTICFTVENTDYSAIISGSDNYVIDRIVISVSLQGKSSASQSVTLKSDTGFIQPGETERVCGTGPSNMYGDRAGWTYDHETAYGWKR